MTLTQIRSNDHLLLKCISGSQAYDLALPHSDTDIRGVFILPKTEFFGLSYTDQINNSTNDEMYYEIKKFIDLLLKNNPNILELLSTPDDCVLFKHAAIDLIKPEIFLSKLCNQTFGQYAHAQIKKARGLNKKILNPVDKQRKNILNFCYVVQGQQSIALTTWLGQHQYQKEDCGLVRIDHMRDIYAIYHQSQTGRKFNGIFSDDRADDVSISSVPNDLIPQGILHFNKDGYSMYCKEHKQYWEWVNERNNERYENTIGHGKNYDSKNMMHVFRLLNMAEEIALEGKVNVKRLERDWLLRVRAGEFSYEELFSKAEEKIAHVDTLFKNSNLPDAPNPSVAETILINIREVYYK